MKEEYFKTKYEEISVLSDTKKCRTVLIKNKDTQELAVKKEMPKEMFEVYSKLSRISAGGIVKVMSCYIEDDKCVDIEEYINGKTLETVLNSGKRNDYIKYVIDVCDTLNVLHAEGIIHRDIQPKNIVIENDKAKLIDFDIARTKKDEGDKDTRLLGTPEYASPEAYGFSQTDERSDIFSLGKLLDVLTDDERYSSIIKKCTEIDPEKRYQTANELKEDIEKIQSGAIADARKSFIETIPGFRTSNTSHKVIACLVYLLAAVIFGGAGFQAKGNIFLKILFAIMFNVWIFVPYAVLMNIGGITDKIIRANYKSEKSKWFVRIMASVIVFLIIAIILGLMLETQ